MAASISSNLFDHPEVVELFQTLLRTLLEESDRGAILIGAAHVDRHLRSLFDAIIPATLGRKRRESLLNYPGPLGNFSARIELAYGLRLIPRITFDALHALRQIRNDLAHSPESFQIRDHMERIHRIYALGPNVPEGIQRKALDLMLDYKWLVAKDTVRSAATGDEKVGPSFETRKDFAEFLSNNPDITISLDKQLPKWELVYGISLLCGSIVIDREKARAVLGTNGTLGSLLYQRDQDAST